MDSVIHTHARVNGVTNAQRKLDNSDSPDTSSGKRVEIWANTARVMTAAASSVNGLMVQDSWFIITRLPNMRNLRVPSRDVDAALAAVHQVVWGHPRPRGFPA